MGLALIDRLILRRQPLIEVIVGRRSHPTAVVGVEVVPSGMLSETHPVSQSLVPVVVTDRGYRPASPHVIRCVPYETVFTVSWWARYPVSRRPGNHV
jgi:hypothetical protein